jgi:hypothetical protein
MVSGKAKRVSTGTESLQIAKEKLRQFESAQARGEDHPLPSRTPIESVVAAYVSHIRTVKTAKSAQTDIYYLRDAFGSICDALKITSRKLSAKTKKKPPKPGQDRRRKAAVIEANCFEQITTANIALNHTRGRGVSKELNKQELVIDRLVLTSDARRIGHVLGRPFDGCPLLNRGRRSGPLQPSRQRVIVYVFRAG